MVATLRVYPTLPSGANGVDHPSTGSSSDLGRGVILAGDEFFWYGVRKLLNNDGHNMTDKKEKATGKSIKAERI